MLESVILNYGNKKININLPEKNLIWTKTPNQIPGNTNDKELIKNALANPIKSKKLINLASNKNNVIIVVDDITRSTPQEKILPIIIERLNQAGITNSNIKILIALGTHRKMNKLEIEEHLGKKIIDKIDIIQHSHRDNANLMEIDKSINNVPVRINKYYYEADLKIVIGSVIPHVNAGWSGGAKMLLPGICGKKTIDQFHLKASYHLDEIQGKTNNIMREDMEEVAKSIGVDFLINIVSNHRNELLYIVTGNYKNAYRKIVNKAKKVFGFSINIKADLTIVSSHPADLDLWQASKALTMAKLATKKEGIILLISPCYEGIAPDHPIVKKLGNKTPGKVYSMVQNDKIDDIAGASIQMEISYAVQNYDVYLYTKGITAFEASKIGLKRITDISNFLEDYIKNNHNAKIGVINKGSKLIPLHT